MDLPAHLLNRISTPVWVVDAAAERLVWANEAALDLWGLDPKEADLPMPLERLLAPAVMARLATPMRDPTRLSKRIIVAWPISPVEPEAVTVASVEEFQSDELRSFFIVTENQTKAMSADIFSSDLTYGDVKVSSFSLNKKFLQSNASAERFYKDGCADFDGRFSEPGEGDVVIEELREGGVAERVTERRDRGSSSVWHKIVATLEHDAETDMPVIVLREMDVTDVMETLTELRQERDAAMAASERKTEFLAVMSHEIRTPMTGVLGLAETDMPVIVLREMDVTDVMETLTELRQERDAAMAASERKTEFLAVMSHEIRTPMTGVLGLAEILHSRIEEPPLKSLAATLQEAGKALLHVTDQVLDLTRIERGRLDLEDAELRPFDFVEAIEGMFQATSALKSLEFSVEAGEGTNLPRTGDRHRILQIINNLVSNAIKFTEKGAVTVELEAPADGPLTISVRDTGVGLSEEEQKRLFRPFAQASVGTSRAFGGSGLGLYIVHDLVTQMNGTITLESAEGKGTIVEVTLPLPLAEAESAAREEAGADAQASNRGLRALIVDDNGVNRQVLQLILQSLDLEVTAAATSDDALRIFERREFDIVMLDIAMPCMSGTVLLRRLRDLEEEQGRVPALMVSVTAHTMDHEVRAYREVGFDGHVAKPLKIEVIKDLIGTFIDDQRERLSERPGARTVRPLRRGRRQGNF
ncbi:MAG: ATP-binding protein [Pseudomonadota bacterium]